MIGYNKLSYYLFCRFVIAERVSNFKNENVSWYSSKMKNYSRKSMSNYIKFKQLS